MAESLFNRVRRLVSASIGDLVDSMEKAGGVSVMREAIREVDRAIDDVRIELVEVGTKRRQAERHIKLTGQHLEQLSEKAQLALGQAREDLAEAALSRQVDLEAQLPLLEATRAEAQAEEAKLESCVAALAARKAEMEADLAAFESARRSAILDVAAPERDNAVERRAEAAEGAFDRAMKMQDGAAGPARADIETAGKLAELERLGRHAKIADRLAALKAMRQAS